MLRKRPQVYLGDTRRKKYLEEIDRLGWGQVVLKVCNNIMGRPFILDNGAFYAGKTGTPWDSDVFMKAVDGIHAAGVTPDFVVLPDVMGGGVRSLDLSLSWIDRLPPEWEKALVSQDGIPPFELWCALTSQKVDVLFLGGTNAYKLHAFDQCRMAHRAGKKFHYGRCGTLEKLRYSMEIGADSIDSTHPLWNAVRFSLFAEVWERGHPQGEMFDLDPVQIPEYGHLDFEVRQCPCGFLEFDCRCGVDD